MARLMTLYTTLNITFNNRMAMTMNFMKFLLNMSLLNRKLLRAKPWAIAGMMLPSLWVTEAHAAREILVMDEHCTINVLNRTVQVAEDGFFTLDNVPSNMGQIKARATCLQEGKLVTAESDYFSVPTNGRISVGEFFKADGNSVPVELQITNEAPITLKKEGATERLSVIARYRNGNTRDVTAVVNGVNYTPSNPDVIRVDANGLITALRSGSSLITARKDGVVGIVRVNVVTSGDSDNDGIPDDIEMANGMNPRDPVDAFEDVDNDGLSALEEYQNGTDINNADSDGDGIKDGEELITGADGFITNPLIADTDGDGLTDGQEIEAGSDPTDVNSANYAELLVGIKATPGEAVLFYNTLDGESSVQLRVVGTLIDGSEVDLTRTSRGTTYQSSDNLIANFGVENGRIYAGQDGIATIAVNNNGFATNVQITVSSFAPVNISNLVFDYNTNLKKLHHYGDSVYIASDFGLHIVDISDPENPVESRRVEIEGGAKDVDVAAGQIYVFTADKVLIYDQQTVEFKSELILPATFADVVINDGNMIIATAAGFHVYALLNPLAPSLISSEIIDKAVKSVDLDGSLLVAVVGNDLLTFSAGNLRALTQLSQFTLPIAGQVELVEEYAYVAPGDGQSQLYSIIDLTSAVEPVQVVTGPDFTAVDLVRAGDYVLYASARPDTSAIPVINVKQVAAPVYQALIPFSSARSRCQSIDANTAFAFCNDDSTLHIVQYRKLQDLSGIAPTITWQTPDYTSTLSQRRSYRVTADVTDDIEVAVVNFYANNELVFSDTAEPYTFIHKVPQDATSQTYRVDALDLASNKASTGDVVFPVVPTGANEEDWKDIDYDYFDEDFLALTIQMDNSRFVAPHKLETIEDFVAKGGQEITVFVDQLNVGGDLIIEANTTLIVKSANGVNINGNLILKEGARLTVPSTIENNYVVLELDVAGDVTLLDGAQIDLDGKGFNLRHTGGPEGELDSTENGSWSCHGGIRTTLYNRDCAYGRYDNPIFAGSAGYVNGANYPAAGGGALKLKANQLNLAATAKISAQGLIGYYYGSGAGGSILLDVNTLKGSGSISVMGGIGRSASEPSGGGGRLAIYLQTDADFLGEYSISGADNSGSGTLFKKYSTQQWGELTIDGNNSKELRYSTPLPNIGRHVITAAELLESGIWKLSVDGAPWEISNESTQRGHIGRQLILDANLPTSKRYQVVSNTINEIIINTDDDISNAVGNTLSGVYVFDKIDIVKNGWLDVGEDQLIVLNTEDSRISKGTLSFDYSVAQALIENAITYGGSIFSKSNLLLGDVNIQLEESSTLTQAHIRAPSIQVSGDFNLTTLAREDLLNATPRRLKLSLLEGLLVTGNVLVDNFILQTGRSEVLYEKYIFPMHIEAQGNISIFGKAHISADGAGYDHVNYFPNFSPSGSKSHAGLIRTVNNPVYGNYWFARFPASAGSSGNYGGGVVYLKASNINNMGLISANGYAISRSSNAAAGGSVHIEAASFNGDGKVYANAGLNSGYYMSSGGRISILSLDNQFTGNYLAGSIGNGNSGTRSSGAGTIFIKSPIEKYGQLIVSDVGDKELKSTPIKNVGEHSIIAAYSTIPGEWNLRVAGTPWQESNNELDYGLTNLEVLLGSRNPSNPRYRIKSNTQNTITIVSDDDLSIYKNQNLVGIHTFKTLTVGGTASVDFGKDVIEVLELNESGVGSRASLYAGSALISDIQLASSGGHLVIDSWDTVPDVVIDIGSGQVTLVNDMTLNSFELNSGDLNFNNLTAQTISLNNSNLSIEHSLSTNDLQLNNATLNLNLIDTVALGAVNSNLTAFTVNATDISLNKSSMITDNVTVINEISLVNEAVISTFSQEATPNKLFTLDVSAGTSISIDETSKIDVGGKGYAASMGYGFNPIFKSMHSGLVRANEGHFFGSLKAPDVHGGGYLGGGVLSIKSPLLSLNGKVLADGKNRNNSYPGAGGSILIEVGTLNGAETGLISAAASAPRYSQYSTGGRVSIITDTLEYLGDFNSASNDQAASGTTLITLNTSPLSDLLVDNKGTKTVSGSTLMPEVGQHQIVDVVQLASGIWELRFKGSNWRIADTDIPVDLSGVYVDLDISSPELSNEFVIERNTLNNLYVTTDTDLTRFIGKTVRGIHKFGKLVVTGGASIDFGQDELRVENLENSEISTDASVHVGYIQSSLMSLVKENGELHFNQSDLTGDWVVDFLPPQGKLVVEGDLTLDNLYLSAGSFEVTGRLDIAGLMTIQNSEMVHVGELSVNNLSVSSSALLSIAKLACTSLSLTNVNSYLGKEINCQNADLTSTTMNIEQLNTVADLNLFDTSKVSSYPQLQGGNISRLSIEVGGDLTIDETSLIDQTGMGYSYLNTLKSIDETHVDNRFASNGGIYVTNNTQNNSVRPVGRFERPYFAAPGTRTRNTSGGAVEIVAARLFLNGKVLSNAQRVGYAVGAGGSIYIQSASIELGINAVVFARSVATGYQSQPAGSGGRIALITSSFVGDKNQIATSAGTATTSGAGTVFIKDPVEQFGSLIINNAGTSASIGSTPVRNVGKHKIQSIYSSGDGWKILVDDNPWSTSELPWSGYSLDGLWVTFGEGLEGQKYQITSNRKNEIFIETNEDLSVFNGGSIQGVHRFKSLVVTNGASLDLGSDLLEITDLVNSEISGDATVKSEYKNLEVLTSISLADSKIYITDSVDTVELTLLHGSFNFEKALKATTSISLVNATFSAPSLVTNDLLLNASNIFVDLIQADDMTLALGSLLTTENLNVENNLQILTNSSINPKNTNALTKQVFSLDIVVGNNITIDDTSGVDASGKGYPQNNMSPGFNFDQAYSNGHGGLCYGRTSGAYGRFDRPKYVGASGNSSSGGGIIRLQSDSLTLNGHVNANGSGGNSGGAGGSILIDTNTLEGSGDISASGGNSSQRSSYYCAGAGGRIKLDLETDATFTGSLLSHSGIGYGTTASGAGSLYKKYKNSKYGSLIIKNNLVDAEENSTPIQGVGKKVIYRVERLTKRIVRLHLLETNYEVLHSGMTQDLTGLQFNITNDQGVVEQYSILDNGLNYLDVEEYEEIILEAGSFVQGVFKLEQLEVADGAFVDWQDNLIEIVGQVDSENDADGDHLSDIDEVILGTSPILKDSDGDGLWDGIESAIGSNPLVNQVVDLTPYMHSIEINSPLDEGRLDLETQANSFELSYSLVLKVGSEYYNQTISGDLLNQILVVSANLDVVGIDTNTRFTGKIAGISELSISLYGYEESYLVSVSDITNHVYLDETVTFNRDRTTNTITLNGSQLLATDSGLTINGDLIVSVADVEGASRNSEIKLKNLVVNGNLIIDSADLTINVSEITVSGNVSLINGAVLTTDQSTVDAKSIYSISLKVAGTLSVDANSEINADGKGYPDDYWSGPDFSYNTRIACHGGIRLPGIDCVYGRYSKAKFAGSGGGNNNTELYGHGGGLIVIEAQTAHIDGRISANVIGGGKYNQNYPAGAGGGVHIETEHLTGEGAITAEPTSTSGHQGSGGRISVYSPLNEFTGNYSAKGIRSYSYITGAGTVYLQGENNAPGTLIVENSNESNINIIHKGTPVRTVGRHIINHISQVIVGEWRVEVSGSPWKATDEVLDWGIQGIDVDLDASNAANGLYEVLSNTENTLLIHTQDDLSGYVGKELLGVHTLEKLILRGKASVDFGDDRLVILDPLNSEIAEVAELFVGEFDKKTEQAIIFTINEQIKGTLIINNHLLSGDVIIERPANQRLVLSRPVAVRSLHIKSGNIDFVSGLTVEKNLTLSGDSTVSLTGDISVEALRLEESSALDVDQVIAENIILLNESKLTTSKIRSNRLVLEGSSTLTVMEASLSGKQVHTLDINVAELVVAKNSIINADGKGYPDDFWSGPDFSHDTRKGCHGGIRLPGIDCVYGRYSKAKFAGSGGGNNSNELYGNGGGLIVIEAQTAHIDGRISANVIGGGNYNKNYPAGAGGGVHIETGHLTGEGAITAEPTSTSGHQGSGGRISVYSPLNEFTGNYSAKGIRSYSYITGAGTVYLQGENNAPGTLIVENSNESNINIIHKGTPVRTVGRHIINHISQVIVGEWRVEVSGSPWKATDEVLDWGIQGIDVDLDASNAANGLYEVLSNTENTLLIHTQDDLSGYVGKELLGVHTLEKLILRGKASVDFGDDRLVILDPLNSEIDEFSELFVGELNPEAWNVFAANTYKNGALLADFYEVFELNETLMTRELSHGITIDNVNVPIESGNELKVRWTGLLQIPEDGLYSLAVDTQGATRISLDSTEVLVRSCCGYEVSSALDLKAGYSEIVIEYENDQGLLDIDLLWVMPGEIEQPITSNYLSYRAPGINGELKLSGSVSFDDEELLSNSQHKIEFAQTVTANSLTISGGDFVFESDLTVSQIFTVLGDSTVVVNGDFSADQINLLGNSKLIVNTVGASGVALSDNAVLETMTVDVAVLQLNDASALSGKSASIENEEIYPLDIKADRISIEAGARITMDAKGYPSNNWSGPEFEKSESGGCHAGLIYGDQTGCTYGNYELARFAGSSGASNGNGLGNGGGLIQITARLIMLNGSVSANGEKGGNYRGSAKSSSGAGGGIHISADEFNGSGNIEANGTSYSTAYVSSSGGRASVYTLQNNFTGQYSAKGAVGGYQLSGAGTIYLKSGDADNGVLIVDNIPAVSGKPLGVTPIRHVGNHQITGVYPESSGEWRIQVESADWRASTANFGYGLQGLSVSLPESGLDNLKIVSNTEDTLLVQSNTDLRGIVGQSLYGVQKLRKIIVKGAAKVDFGEDHLIVEDIDGSLVEEASELVIGNTLGL